MIDLDDITVNGRPAPILYRPSARYDVFRVPVLGHLLTWRWGRLLFQIPLLIIAGLLIYDGLTGPRLASQNLATVSVWVHYRGLIILVLLFVGNLFCMGCPFTVPRTLAQRMSAAGRRWPRPLRNKWLAVAAFAGFLYLYEGLDLWASPWLTAWIIIGYFVAAFVLEALFAESPFCKYVCPLGTFNFVGATIAPTQITVRSHDTCRICVGKECVNGSAQTLGCGTELFPPTLASNLDCIYCLDCARACPYDNVALVLRTPGRELVEDTWPKRTDTAFLAMVVTFAGLGNAFGMVPPFYDLQIGLSTLLHTTNEALLLFIIFGILIIVLPAAAGISAAWVSQRLAGVSEPLKRPFARFAPAFVPLSMGIWLAHYGFHFSTGALAIIPVFQSFLLDHGLTWLGSAPDWTLGPILPGSWVLPLQTAAVLIGFGASLFVANRIAHRHYQDSGAAMRSTLPWVLLFLGLAIAAMWTFNLPMEMRGTVFLGG